MKQKREKAIEILNALNKNHQWYLMHDDYHLDFSISADEKTRGFIYL